MKVVWSIVAEQRVIEAFEAIAADRPEAAARWLRELLTKVESLDRFAKRGRKVPEIGKSPYRQLQHYPYRVVYRVDATQVVVITVRHSRRAWDPSEVARDG